MRGILRAVMALGVAVLTGLADALKQYVAGGPFQLDEAAIVAAIAGVAAAAVGLLNRKLGSWMGADDRRR